MPGYAFEFIVFMVINTSDIIYNDLINKMLTKCHSEQSEESITLYYLSIYRLWVANGNKVDLLQGGLMWMGFIKPQMEKDKKLCNSERLSMYSN